MIPDTLAQTIRRIYDEVMNMERVDCRNELANLCLVAESLATRVEPLERLAQSLTVALSHTPGVAAIVIEQPELTQADFIETAMARLVVTGSTPRDSAIRTMWLAQALWRERERRHWTGFKPADREFIDMTALIQPAGKINFISPEEQCLEEARTRYEIAVQRWVAWGTWKDDPTYFGAKQ